MDSFKKNFRWFFLAGLCAVNVFIWYAVSAESRAGVLTVAFLDVGQGDAIFIEAPDGAQMLIDGGPNRAVLQALSGVMPFYDRSIDVVVATHPDADHIGGLPEVLDQYDISFFVEPGTRADTKVFKTLQEKISAENAERIIARRGMDIALGDEVLFRVLSPDRDMSGKDTNESSIVGVLQHKDVSFLLTGDAPLKIENAIMRRDPGVLKVQVLKVGHHGSKTSTGEQFLNAVSPEYAVVSSGKENRYGHPHESVVSRLKDFGVHILRTDELGSIIFSTDGTYLKLEN